jgi:hypothetical protein
MYNARSGLDSSSEVICDRPQQVATPLQVSEGINPSLSSTRLLTTYLMIRSSECNGRGSAHICRSIGNRRG